MRADPDRAGTSRSSRQQREFRTVTAMVELHCRRRHGTESPCAACQDLLAFAELRLSRCPFGERKSTCARCPIHCYQQDRRQQMREVMRDAGPRMLWRHPWLALRHWLDGFRRAPSRRASAPRA